MLGLSEEVCARFLRVRAARTENGEEKLVIDFEAAGTKTLLARFVNDE